MQNRSGEWRSRRSRRRTAALFFPRFGRAAALCAAAVAFTVSALPRPARADLPVRALLTRRLPAPVPVPAAADALQFSVWGDGSGARLQARLLALNGGPDVGAYFAAPALRLDFKGWKRVTLPLSDFTFQNEQAPEAAGGGASAPLTGADTLQIAVTATSAKIFLDDVVWLAQGAAGPDAPPAPAVAVIDDFEGAAGAAGSAALAAWRASGNYEQVQALSFGVNRLAGFVRSGAGSLQIVVRTRAVNDRQLHAPALDARLKRAPTQPYVVFVRPPFERIVPDSVPAPSEVPAQPRLSLFACADETEPVSFAVYAAPGKDLVNATVTVASDLVSESKQARIPRAAISLHVVKVWEQAGLGSVFESGETISVPELLVKDDRVPLTGPAPAVRLTGDPQTTIPGGTSKQFWVTVRVPRNQPASTYTGKLVFSAPGVKPTGIALVVEVLPMRLRLPFLQYGIDFRSRLAADKAAPGEPAVTPEVFQKQLENIRDHGFRFVSLYDPLPALGEALRAYQRAQLSPSGPVVVMTPVDSKREVEEIEKLRVDLQLGPTFDIYFGTPAASHPGGTEEAQRRLAEVRKASRKGLTVAPIAGQAAFDALDPVLDVPVYAITAEYPQKLLVTGKRENPKRDWWSWNLAREDPRTNRLYTGFLLYRTGLNGAGLYGAFPGPYQYAPSGDPFDEAGVAAAPAEGDDAATTTPRLRPQMTTYPAEGGVIDTLQWEAAREGIDDVRYITNLKTYLREIKDLKIRKDATDAAEAFLAAAMKKPLATLPPAEYQAVRRGIADQALKLLTILRGNARRYPD